MSSEAIDSIDNSKEINQSKIILKIGLALLLLAAFIALIPNQLQTFSLRWWFGKFEAIFIPSFLILVAAFGKPKPQYIMWQNDGFKFKVTNQITEKFISIDEIRQIEVRINFVEILTKDGAKTEIPYNKFRGYEAQKKIKNNFEKMKSHLSNV
jgi:hypothetical protein